MRVAKILAITTLLSVVFALAAGAAELLAEHVTGGQLDQQWVGGFNTPNSMYGKTLDAGDPAYANPSGDHTVAVAQNASPDSGGIIVTTADPGAIGDYTWEGWIFTGAGDTRRGIILRADPSNNFQSFYMMVIEPGLFQMRFRKLINGAPTTLASWFANVLPAGSIPANTWHHLKVRADGSTFRVWFDDFELTAAAGAIVDSDLSSGWVGVYNFKFDLGNVPVYYDDLVLSCLSATTVAFDFKPNTLDLKSAGKWIDAEITPPPPLTANDIDVASLRLNGKVAVDPSKVEIKDDGATLKVKFRRADVLLTLTPGDAVPVTLTGLAAGGCIEGTDVVRVKAPKVHHPHDHDLLAAGASMTIDWDSSIASAQVAILQSVDGGDSWTIVANGVANTGTYQYTVPNVSTGAARLAVVEIESIDPSDPTGYTVSGTVGLSDTYSIAGTLGVGAAGAEFALRPIGNPSTGGLRVSFSLPANAPAKLDVFDVTGRAIASRDVVDGAGAHTLRIAEWVPAGVYVVRLSQSGRSLSTRITVVK